METIEKPIVTSDQVQAAPPTLVVKESPVHGGGDPEHIRHGTHIYIENPADHRIIFDEIVWRRKWRLPFQKTHEHRVDRARSRAAAASGVLAVNHVQ